VRVEADLGDSTGYGSGTIVTVGPEYAAIVTAKHVVRGIKGRITVRHTTGVYPARLIATDPSADLAALAITARTGAISLGIANERPTRGFMLGFGATGNAHIHEGGYQTDVRATSESSYDHTFAFVAHEGDSGGGLFNERGKFAGVVWGTSPDTGSVSVGTAKLKAFLTSPVCFRWFRRPNNVTVNVNTGAGSNPVVVSPPSPVDPTPSPPVNPPVSMPGSGVSQSVIVNTPGGTGGTTVEPTPVAPAQDLTGLYERVGKLESQMVDAASTLRNLNQITTNHTAQLNRGMDFVTISPSGQRSGAVTKRMGDTLEIVRETGPAPAMTRPAAIGPPSSVSSSATISPPAPNSPH